MQPDTVTPIDVGFQVFNQVTYPNMIEWFDRHGVGMEKSDMSLAVSSNGLEWSSDGLGAFFVQKCNLINPWFHRMLYEVVSFKADVLKFLDRADPDTSLTLGEFLRDRGYSKYFTGTFAGCPSVSPSLLSLSQCFVQIITSCQW